MLTRLTHSAIAFAITVVVYQAYVLIAAPLVDPAPQTPSLAQRGTTETPQATHKYRKLLAAYFPADHWTLTQPPITAENSEAMIVLDDYNPRDDGQVRVKKCVILFFPSGRVRGEPAPRDAVILEAPHGAVLQMDSGFKRVMAGLGKLQTGKLTGKITVRSDMREAGPHDDLLLTTRDVEIQEGLIYTRNQVDMQLGPHRGHGRQLEIRLVAVERSRSQSPGPNLGSIDSLEIMHDVQAELAPDNVSLGPNAGPTDSQQPPVKIASGGKFRFDFSNQVASFNEQVRLTQLHPQGQLDELRCEQLLVYFSRQGESATSRGKLAPALLEALGNAAAPVVLNAPSQQAAARCERMRVELGPQRVTFDQGPEVALRFEGNEIHAKQVQYTAPPKGSQQRIGDFRASGSGWLRANTSDEPDGEPFEVRWTENMRLRRINGQPVLSLNGRPRLDMVGMGRLWADHFDLFLRERAADGSEDELLPSDVVPERLVAGGQIAIDSAEIHGKVRQLQVQFDYAPNNLMLNAPNDGQSTAAHTPLRRRGKANRRSYDIVGETLQMLVTVRDSEPEVTSLDVDGHVVFNESPSQTDATKQPLKVVADHLHVENADSPSAEITLSGRPSTITADGMLIRTENLKINRGTSRAWVNAPGEIEMLVDRDLNGNSLPAPQPMTIHWQRSMQLDQDRITFSGDVHVQTAEGQLATQQMVVQLTAPVQFDGAASQRKVEIAQLECSGGASAIFSQRDAMGLSSVQTIKLEESFLANLKTGELRGTGPGQIESVHLSDAASPFDGVADNGRGQLASAKPRAAQRLRFLGVQFLRGIVGNLHSKQVKVVGDVDAVYGPVDAWEQRLSLTKRGMPGPDTVWINCQSLGVAESPLARLQRSQQSKLGPLELLAKGDVTIEGPYGERGNFTTRSQRAKFDQTKKNFILEGTNRDPASLILQEYRGAPTSPTSARKITYFQETGNVKVEGLVSGQFRQLSP